MATMREDQAIHRELGELYGEVIRQGHQTPEQRDRGRELVRRHDACPYNPGYSLTRWDFATERFPLKEAA